jgi:hypothetical protein
MYEIGLWDGLRCYDMHTYFTKAVSDIKNLLYQVINAHTHKKVISDSCFNFFQTKKSTLKERDH